MKVFFRNIHLYLSLAAGIVIALVCFTGAVLVFEKEWQMFLYPERYQVAAGTQRVPIAEMEATLRQKIPHAEVSSVKIYGDPARTVEFNYREEKGEASEGKQGGPPGGGSQAFINPYTGQVVGLASQRSPFFFTIFSLHRWLLAGETGKLIVGVSTSAFLFILLTGIILWWPKNKKILEQRLRLKWNAGWKRLNHDMHIVVGFYAAIFLFAFAFTGLAWSFKWFNDGIYWITGTESKRPEPPLSDYYPGAIAVSFDEIYAAVQSQTPRADYYSITIPKEDSAAISVTVMPSDAVHERATNQLFFDQYSGALIGQSRYAERNLGQRVRATFYPVHVGSIAGLPGRIIAFVACLAGVTFPVTGVILWVNRLRKNKKNAIPSRTFTA